MSYDYRCPRCDSRKIVFKEIADDNLVFYCQFCEEDFITKDKEGGFLPQKIESLRKRYSLLRKKRDSRKKRLAHRRNFNRLSYYRLRY